MKYWYLIQTRVHQEFTAEENLARQGYSIYLPTINNTRRRRGQWQGTEEPFFPGYLFINLDTGIENSSTVRSTRGVLKLVRFGQEPQPVPSVIVDDIRQRVNALKSTSANHLPLRKGDRVMIMEGSFKGVEAIFAAETGKQRVELLMQILGRQHKLTLDRNDISPLD